jgi:uncharacterized repeat protein (TIGR03806 family)
MADRRGPSWRTASALASQLWLAACASDGPGDLRLDLAPAFPNLAFNAPVAMAQAPGDGSRWYLLEKAGRLYVFDNVASASVRTLVADLSARVDARAEGGLLGIAFHPQYASNAQVYLSYTSSDDAVADNGANFRSVIARFTLAAGGTALDPASEHPVLTLAQPFGNHNGGHIAFGADGYLYIGFGDGGSGGDPFGHGQDTRTLLGAMLRVDVDVTDAEYAAGTRYKIPPDNPFAASPGCGATTDCPEIYAWGLRNPWRWSFDRATGDLWLGDVGQNVYEEIDVVKLGSNLGWRQREGAHCYNPGTGCITAGMTEPVVEYTHANGRASIVGGFVYRGTAIPSLVGSYLFGDTYTGEIFTVRYDAMNQPMLAVLLDTPQLIYSFAEDADGEVYIVSANNNGLYKITPMGTPVVDNFPKTLSATGCFEASDATKPVAGLIPYAVNAPLWSDGADKKRWMAVPDGQRIKLAADGDFDFPNGSVMVKEFSLNQKRVETRLFMRHSDGGWAGYTYEWNGAGTDANLLPAGKTSQVGTQTWTFPSRNECVSCHTNVAGGTLGLEIAQLNYEYVYEATNRMSNQIATLDHIGLFETSPGDPTTLPLLPAYDSMAPLQARAKAYLHANCSICHRPMGTGRGPQDFRFATAVNMAMLCNVDPQEGTLGIAGAKLIAPGDPSKSIVSARLRALDTNRMPPLATRVVDPTGTKLIDDWIMSLTSCP